MQIYHTAKKLALVKKKKVNFVMEAPEVSEKSWWDHFGLYIVLLNIHSNTLPYITLQKATFLQSFQCLTQVKTPKSSSKFAQNVSKLPRGGVTFVSESVTGHVPH